MGRAPVSSGAPDSTGARPTRPSPLTRSQSGVPRAPPLAGFQGAAPLGGVWGEAPAFLRFTLLPCGPARLGLTWRKAPGLCAALRVAGKTTMHAYRTHTCGALRAADAGPTARLSGWVHRKRDHGGLLFIDLRDHYGMTQCVFAAGSPAFAAADAAAAGERDHRHRHRWCRASRTPSTRSCRPARSSCRSPSWRCSRPPRCCRCRSPARRNIPEEHAPEIPLPRPAARQGAPQHRCCARR